MAGGGKETYFMLDKELARGTIEINARSLPLPNSLEQLQDNYALFEDKDLDVNFR